ncbi:MAG: hypothetical protein U1F54_11020 [Burkholderiales bacterium]
MKLNVGCGRNSLDGWVNIDAVQLPGVDLVVDLDTARTGDDAPLLMPQWRDRVEEFLLSHVIEHLRNPLGVMQELWALAAPDARMVIRCPHGASDDADEDPTHVRRMFPGSFGYFGQPYYWRADYGYRGDWMVDAIALHPYPEHAAKPDFVLHQLVRDQRNVVQEMVVTLHAVRPRREPLRDLQHYVAPQFVR